MSRRKKAPPSEASQAYLISFGDTMTALLAFFIVLNSLAEEQSGADLHAGTGSFVQALHSMGLPGKYNKKTSARIVQLNKPNTLYVVGDGTPGPSEGLGPDAADNELPILDREQEQFQRYFNEMERLERLAKLPDAQGQVVFDFFELLQREPPHLPKSTRRALIRALPAIHEPGCRMQLVVWATTPGRSAWERAVTQSRTIAESLADAMKLDPATRKRLRPVGRPWPFSDEKRPVVSLVVTQVR